jgi:uncharacterized protein (DUF58 family)
MSSLAERYEGWAERVGEPALAWANRLTPLADAVLRRASPVLRVVAPLGWLVLGVALGAWLVGVVLGWVELTLLAATGLCAFAACTVLTLGRTVLRVTIDVRPLRLTAGTRAAGRVEVANLSRRRLLPIALELPVGRAPITFDLPVLGGGAQHDEMFVVPTERRGVVPVGPATTVRGDPFGLLRRAVSWTDVTELFVHPVTVALESFGAGLLRDLEGRTTKDISLSDLAFHTLRDYAPGDDRRYIHWRSSAKVGASALGGRFLVRQFLDTRRSRLLVVVDGDPAAYTDQDDFETAISAGASMAVRALRDEMDTTVVAAGHVVRGATVQSTLDGFARVAFGGIDLVDAAARGSRVAADTSIALLVTGAAPTFARLRAAAAHFPPEVTTVAVRVDPAATAGISSAGSLTVLTLATLAELPALLRAVDRR